MVIAAIVAGGVGTRMGSSSLPKQFLEIGGKPVVIHTVEKFVLSADIDAVVIGVHADWVDYLQDLLDRYLPDQRKVSVTAGGENRNETILRIVEKAEETWELSEEDVIVTHDAVRPFVSLQIIEENVRAAREYGACDTVIPATDTIVSSEDGCLISGVPARETMYQGQTPQSFRYDLFREVYQSTTAQQRGSVTDACKLFYLCGKDVHLVFGSTDNMKITYPFDLKMADAMLGGRG